MKDLTPNQKKAIDNMNNAIKLLKKEKIRLFGMDHNILYISTEAINNAKKIDSSVGHNYCDGADAYRLLSHNSDNPDYRMGQLETTGVYIDSGGW